MEEKGGAAAWLKLQTTSTKSQTSSTSRQREKEPEGLGRVSGRGMLLALLAFLPFSALVLV